MSTQADMNQAPTVTLEQAANLILDNPRVRFGLFGEPGIGKTAIEKILVRKSGYKSFVLAMTEMELGDLALPVINHETKTTSFYPSERFGLHLGEPVICILDEWTKAPKAVQNMSHGLLEVGNPRLGCLPAPEGSIILMTGNLASDGVGDSMQAHTSQRIIKLHIAKPDAQQWDVWASENSMHPIIRAWVDRNPHCLASYLDADQKNNEFIFNPRTQQNGCISPRVLELISRVLYGRSSDAHATHAAIAGIGGLSAANSISAYIRHSDGLPAFQDITDNPSTAKLPVDPGACAVLTFGMLERVDAVTLKPILKYLRRLDEEWQCIFCIALARNNEKQKFAFSEVEFADWVRDNEDLL
jgi:hypothetical protein